MPKNELTPMEYSNQRILTTQQIAEAYGTEVQVVTNNFNRNKVRYEKGKHYYCLKGSELKAFKAATQIDLLPNVHSLYLWTERGALLHAKSLNTDTAWKVYDHLVDHYFKPQAAPPALPAPASGPPPPAFGDTDPPPFVIKWDINPQPSDPRNIHKMRRILDRGSLLLAAFVPLDQARQNELIKMAMTFENECLRQMNY